MCVLSNDLRVLSRTLRILRSCVKRKLFSLGMFLDNKIDFFSIADWRTPKLCNGGHLMNESIGKSVVDWEVLKILQHVCVLKWGWLRVPFLGNADRTFLRKALPLLNYLFVIKYKLWSFTVISSFHCSSESKSSILSNQTHASFHASYLDI